MFLKQLSLQSNPHMVLEDLTTTIESTQPYLIWEKMHQLGITSRPTATDPWADATGSLYDRVTKTWRGQEVDYTQWNIPTTSYTRTQITLLQEHLGGIPLGRIRWMRLLPKTGLSVHKDLELRYHLVLKTNPRAYIAHETGDINPLRSTLPTTASTYHMPLDGHWYQVDTREIHWVYNGGTEERIHLVVCGV